MNVHEEGVMRPAKTQIRTMEGSPSPFNRPGVSAKPEAGPINHTQFNHSKVQKR